MISIKYNEKDPLNGILSNFYKISSDFVGFNASLGPSSARQSIVVERNQDNCLFWYGKTTDGNFTIILKHKLLLTDYVLMNAGCSSASRSYPEAFNLYGSNDNKKWTLIDERTNQKFCGTPGCTAGNSKKYSINIHKPFTHFKFVSLINSESQSYTYFIMRQIEFFGVINPSQCNTKCIKTYTTPRNIHFIICIIYST